MAAFSDATVPAITECQVFVASDLIHASALARPVDYGAQLELSRRIPCDGESTPTLRDLRDRAVEAAKADSRIPASIEAHEFQLLISRSDAIVPDNSLPVLWLAVYAVEVGAVDARLKGGTLQVDLIKRRDQLCVQPRQNRVKQKLLEKRLELIAARQGSVVLIEGDFGMGKSNTLMTHVQNALPTKSSVFCATGNPFSRGQP